MKSRADDLLTEIPWCQSPSADVPVPDQLGLRGAITKRLTVRNDVGCLTKTSWTDLTIWMDVRSHQHFLVSFYLADSEERKNLDSKVEARRTWLSKWMKFSHQNFMVRFYLSESSIALTETQRCKQKELDLLKGCWLSRQNFLVRFYLAESSMAWTWTLRWEHKEPDYLNGCRFSYQSFLVRVYLARKLNAWTLDLKTVP